MKIVEMWIVNKHEMLVKLENGDYMHGTTSNIYGFSRIEKKDAVKMIAESTN